jgi:hypothetical protein
LLSKLLESKLFTSLPRRWQAGRLRSSQKRK